MQGRWSDDDIIEERKRADRMYDSGYNAGYKAGYRKARIEILGKDVVLKEESEWATFVEGVIADITKGDAE